MPYVGIQAQIHKNNINSLLLIIAFPLVLLGMVYAFLYFVNRHESIQVVNYYFSRSIPTVLFIVGLWFLIAWLFHTSLIRYATGSRPLERRENKRVYNLVENLCIQTGQSVPKIYIIEDDSLNAFASGINERTFSISLSRGIIEKLDDEELEGVIAHELTHIRNRDVRLLIISIIFVGIFAFIAQMAFRSLQFGAYSRRRDKNNLPLILIAIVIAAICYFIAILLRFGISRSREYLADAGAAELTKKPYALASALRKIDQDPLIEAVQSRDVAQLFIDNPSPEETGFSFSNLFSTHPPIKKRIQLLDQFV
jgi:heat shock protein HtpX